MLFMNAPTAPQHDVSAHRVAAMLATFDRADASAFELQIALASAWGAGFVKPHLQLPRERWVSLFRRVGYFSFGTRPTPPREPIRLYRGAADGHERGMSWTTSPDLARRFDFALWTCDAPPSSVLAVLAMHRYDANGDDFGEYVLNLPDDLAVVETCAPGHGGRTLAFRGRTEAKVTRNVRRFLADVGLDDLRPSALGWRISKLKRDGTARVEFFGYSDVLLQATRRHARWSD